MRIEFKLVDINPIDFSEKKILIAYIPLGFDLMNFLEPFRTKYLLKFSKYLLNVNIIIFLKIFIGKNCILLKHQILELLMTSLISYYKLFY